MNSNRPDYLIFLHIPKTAGSTMRDILTTQYGDRHTVMRVRGLFKKNFKQLNDQIPGLLASIAPAATPKVLSGHIPYGLHQHLSGTCEYFTFIRHPLDYVLSMYYFNLQFIRQGITPLDPDAEYPLEWMLDRWHGTQFNNYQARFLASRNNCFKSVTEQATDSTTLSIPACELLNQELHFVFPVDQFDSAVNILSNHYNWSVGLYRDRKVNRARPRQLDIPAQLKQRILDSNAVDMQLYLLAQQRIQQLSALTKLP